MDRASHVSDADPFVPPVGFWTSRRLVEALGIVVVLPMAVAMVALGFMVGAVRGDLADVRQAQRDGEKRGYVNRAESCRLHVLLGAEPSPGCLQPEVLALYDRDEPPTAGADSQGQRTNRALMCAVIVFLKIPTTECGP